MFGGQKNNKLYHGDISCSELESHDIHIDADYSNWIAEVKLLATHKKNLILCTKLVHNYMILKISIDHN